MAMLNKLRQQQAATYMKKKTQITGVKLPGDRTGQSLNLGGALTLEDMNLDRKADFEGDAFDPFNIGQSKSNLNLQLKAQNAQFDMANSKGGHIWAPEQIKNTGMAGNTDGFSAQAAQAQAPNYDDLDDLEEIDAPDESMPASGTQFEINTPARDTGINNRQGGNN